jgi:hypothetical protein
MKISRALDIFMPFFEECRKIRMQNHKLGFTARGMARSSRATAFIARWSRFAPH